MLKKLLLFMLCLFIFLLIFIKIGLNNPLSVSKVSLSSEKVDAPIKIALVSDLHSSLFGENQANLIELISNSSPDIVCFSGDLFDDYLPNENAELLIAGISKTYPCYYVTGNHEYLAGEEEFNKKMAILKKYGVIRLKNEVKKITVNNQKINLIGVDDPQSGTFDLSVVNSVDKSCYSILLSHRPEYFQDYSMTGVDLVLSGHAHGGQWRIPIILNNGFIAPDQGFKLNRTILGYSLGNLGFFPKYTSGQFTKDNTTMVVSRGLQPNILRFPRFYNKPEVVILEIN